MSRRKDWKDDPFHLLTDIEKSAQAHSHEEMESRSYLAEYYARPQWTPQMTTSQFTVDKDGLKKLGFNLMAEATAGAKAQVCKPLQAKVLPVGKDVETMIACENFNKLIDGLHDTADFMHIAESLFVDGALTGQGFAVWEVNHATGDMECHRLDPLRTWMSADGHEVRTERVMSRRECRAKLGQLKAVGKDEGGPDVDLRDIIDHLDRYKREHIPGVDSATAGDDDDLVCFGEAWAEPIGTLEPGSHVIQLNGNTVIVEKWDTMIPVFRFEYDVGHRSNEPRGLGRTIGPYHYWRNAMVRKLHDAIAGAVPVITGDEDILAKMSVDNLPWKKIPVPKGKDAPVVTTAEPVSQQVIEHEVRLHEGGMREAGVNTSAAAGEAPPQYKSGLAIQEWRAQLNTRLSQQARQWERCWTWSGRIIASRAPVVYKTKPVRTRASGTDVLEAINWEQINLPEDKYSISFQVVGGLSQTVSGQLEILDTIKSYEIGFDGLDVIANLRAPDLKAASDRLLAPRRLVEVQISKALKEGKYLAPMEAQDFEYMVKATGNAWQQAIIEDRYPEKNLECLRRLYRRSKAWLAAKPPAAPAAPAPGAPPIASAQPVA